MPGPPGGGPLGPTNPPPPLLDQQLAVHPHSTMRGMTTTPSAKWLFQSEGATLVFIDTMSGGTYNDTGFELLDGVKRVPLSSKGVLAARMALDPDSADPPEDGANDLLYIAAGRDGLWLLEADTRLSGTNAARRVDDATTTGAQDSARFCCDVEVVTVQGVQYLLALFTKKEDSKLRIYLLDDVRAVAQGATETGFEIPFHREVTLGTHPNAPTAPTEASFGKSAAIAMDCDVFGSNGQERADVYVAMGGHGLASVLSPI